MYPRSIYVITHVPTGRRYVGSSNDVGKRWKRHIWELEKGIHPVEDMQRDYDLLGGKYDFAVIGQINDESEAHKEYDCMIERRSNIRGRGYNYKDRKCPRESTADMEKRLLEAVRNSEDRVKATKVATAIISGVLLQKSIEDLLGTRFAV